MALVALCITGMSAVDARGDTAPAPLPAQAALPAPACSPAHHRPGEWTAVTRVPDFLFAAPYELHVDPWMPCRIYRAATADTLERSDDGGRSFRPVFHDDATTVDTGSVTGGSDPSCGLVVSGSCALTSSPFTMSWVTVPAPGMVALGERGNGDAAVLGSAGGRAWTLIDDGLAGQQVQRLTFAPSDPHVGYAVLRSDTPNQAIDNAAAATARGTSGESLMPPAQSALFWTADGGRSWSPSGALPAIPYIPGLGYGPADGLDLSGLAIDPTDASHLWVSWTSPRACAMSLLGGVAVSGQLAWPQVSLVVESHDHGQTWSVDSIVPGAAGQLLATEVHPRQVRLLAAGIFSQYPSSILASNDGGRSWSATPAPPITLDATGVNAVVGVAGECAFGGPEMSFRVGMAADPVHPGRMLAVVDHHGMGVALYSADGLATVARRYDLPGVATCPTLLTRSNLGAPETVVQADRLGDFYVSVDTASVTAATPTGGLSVTSYHEFLEYTSLP